MEEGAKEGKESMMIRGLPLACVKLMDVILLDKRGKQRISEKKNSSETFSGGDSCIVRNTGLKESSTASILFEASGRK